MTTTSSAMQTPHEIRQKRMAAKERRDGKGEGMEYSFVIFAFFCGQLSAPPKGWISCRTCGKLGLTGR
jgi:hypothetical protein